MRQNSSSSSTDSPSSLSDQNQFLQNSSLFTALPPVMQDVKPKTSDQKTLSPIKLTLAQLDSQGEIRINITVPNSALTLVKLLGEGGFGSVYQGLYNGELVAIKRLKMQHLTDKAIEELRNEAKIMFQLGLVSKYIVLLKKICLEAPYYSLVMELMPKGSLYDLLRNGQPLPWDIRYRIALDAALGLKDLHGYRILHRDLKSMNILLDDRLRAKLADFGLAKVKHESSSQSSAAKGGTVLWMAPELFDDEPKITTESDIYSFGMVLWELVTRTIPYAKWRPEAAGIRIAQGKKEEIPEDCPPELKKIIEPCWNLTPAKRPTAAQVAERLKPLVTTEEQKQSSTPSTLSPKEDPRELEMQKLKAEMEQLKLEHEQQRRAAAEEKQRSEVEKQKEIERLKQQHQAELKRSQEESKPKPSQTIAPPTKLAPIPAIPPTSQSRQTLMPTPKLPASPEQLKLQDQLIAACKQGDEKMATALLKQGAKPDMSNAKGEQPLGAAVWGMCPDVVNALLKQAGGVAPMTWDECEKHNLIHYKEAFVVPKFDPQTFGEWDWLLQKIDPNPFIRTYHLKVAEEKGYDTRITTWEKLRELVRKETEPRYYDNILQYRDRFNGYPANKRVANITEAGFVGFRTQIKQGVETAKRPEVEKQEEIERLKQQHQAELKRNQEKIELKLPPQTPVTPTKSAPMPSVSQIIPQTMMPAPKPTASAEQLKLQDQLIAACKQGDEKMATALLMQGAKPDMANAKGEQPLGAAIWGMCPDVVNTLLKQAGGVAPMTWDECEKHNLKYYNEVFIIPKFDPQTFGEWNDLLQKMDPNPFIRAYHLKNAAKRWLETYTSSWFSLKSLALNRVRRGWGHFQVEGVDLDIIEETEAGFVSYRSQIKQGIETAKQLTAGKTF